MRLISHISAGLVNRLTSGLSIAARTPKGEWCRNHIGCQNNLRVQTGMHKWVGNNIVADQLPFSTALHPPNIDLPGITMAQRHEGRCRQIPTGTPRDSGILCTEAAGRSVRSPSALAPAGGEASVGGQPSTGGNSCSRSQHSRSTPAADPSGSAALSSQLWWPIWSPARGGIRLRRAGV